MTTTTATVSTVRALRLTCNHSITGDDLFAVPADDTRTGAKVECPKCPARKSGALATRRVREVVTGPATVKTLPAPAPAPAPEPQPEPEPARVNGPHTADEHLGQEPQGYDVQAASAEWKALRDWQQAGREGERPSTANLDAMNAAHAAGKPRSGRKARKANQRPTKVDGLQFTRNGRPLNKHNQVLSALAWQSTKGLGADGGRLNAAQLRAMLAEAGITEPEAGPWEHTLANGVTIGATLS